MARRSKSLPVDDGSYKHMEECFLCQRDFRFGPHRYAGRRVGAWDIMVCETCEAGNWDGLVLERHPRLVEHLRANGLKVRLNARGWVDIPK